MSILFKILSLMGMGFLTHFTHFFLDMITDVGQKELGTYAVGMTGCFPVCLNMFETEFAEITDTRRRYTLAYFVGAFLFGAGVVIARLIESAYRERKQCYHH